MFYVRGFQAASNTLTLACHSASTILLTITVYGRNGPKKTSLEEQCFRNEYSNKTEHAPNSYKDTYHCIV